MSKLAVVILTAAPEGLQNDGAAMLKVDGRESIVRSMELFANREGIVQTMIVINKAEAEEIKRKIGSHLMFMGIKLVQSGATWIDQLVDAYNILSTDATHILVHDGARPVVPYNDLDTLIAAAEKNPAVGLAQFIRGQIASVETLPGSSKITPGKTAILQSPTIYSREAFDAIVSSKKLPESLHLIEGSPLNVRCGTTEPSLVKAMIGLLPKPKIKAPSSPFEEAQW